MEDDYFKLIYPNPKNPDERLYEKVFYGNELTTENISKHVPNGYVFVGLVDSDDFDQGDDLEDLEPGEYTVTYNISENSFISEIIAEDIARAQETTKALLTEDPIQELKNSSSHGNHDIFGTSIGTVYCNSDKWNYLISLTKETVIVTIQCESSQNDFLHFDNTVEFSSTCGQGEGHIHPLGYQIASSLPYHTLLSLCISNTTPFNWNEEENKEQKKKQKNNANHQKNELEKRKLIFTGISMSGMVAHIAAIIARENYINFGEDIEVKAIGFNSPNGISCGIVDSLSECGFSKHHLTFCRKYDVMMRIYQLVFDVQIAKIKTNDTVFDSESLVSQAKNLQSTKPQEVSNAWKIVNSLNSGALDMIDAHFQATKLLNFIPVGEFTFLSSESTIKQTKSNSYEILKEIYEIHLNHFNLRIHKTLENIPTPETSFNNYTNNIIDISSQLCPKVTSCHVLASPGNPERNILPKLDITINTGENLENVIQRYNSVGVPVEFINQNVASKAPIRIDKNITKFIYFSNKFKK